MVIDTTHSVSSHMGTKNRFSFSIANILGDTLIADKATETVITSAVTLTRNDDTYAQLSRIAPRDHSTPNPDSAIVNTNQSRPNSEVFDTNTANMQTDILKQSWEIAFNGTSYTEDDEENEDALHMNTAKPHASTDTYEHRTSTPIPHSPNTSIASDDRTSSPTDTERIRAKKARTSFSTKQLRELEIRYSSMRYIAATDRSALARSLGLTDQQVKTWFQNRRMKEKRNVQDGSESPQSSSTHTPSPQNVPHPQPALMSALPSGFNPLLHPAALSVPATVAPTLAAPGHPTLGMITSTAIDNHGLLRPQPISVSAQGHNEFNTAYSQALPFPVMTSHAALAMSQMPAGVPQFVQATQASAFVPQRTTLPSHMIMPVNGSAFTKVSSMKENPSVYPIPMPAISHQNHPIIPSYTPSFMGQLTGANMPISVPFHSRLTNPTPVYM